MWLFEDTSSVFRGEGRCRRNRVQVVRGGDEDGGWVLMAPILLEALALRGKRVLDLCEFFTRSETRQGGGVGYLT